jgi:hypothetical protein
MSFAWRCPFCSHNATIGSENNTSNLHSFSDGNKYGLQAVYWQAITCPNPDCREYALKLSVHDYAAPPGGGQYRTGKTNYAWQLVPGADMKVLPDYVLAPIVADYREACLICDLSPKASATLARRCLQGMIRDYWGVSKGRLVDEIKEIEGKVDRLAWDAIEAVRSIGNIGAHMEKDIDVIVDVEPQEARLLIELIETLVDDWYVTRHDRQSRLAKLKSVAQDKQQARKKQE